MLCHNTTHTAYSSVRGLVSPEVAIDDEFPIFLGHVFLGHASNFGYHFFLVGSPLPCLSIFHIA